jgi:hypothetical protein
LVAEDGSAFEFGLAGGFLAESGHSSDVRCLSAGVRWVCLDVRCLCTGARCLCIGLKGDCEGVGPHR